MRDDATESICLREAAMLAAAEGPTHTSPARLNPGRLTRRDERLLRARLIAWSVRFLGLAPAEFADAYQQAWESVMRAERKGRPVRNLEHALRWGVSNAWRQECRRRRRRPADPLDDANDGRLADPASTDPFNEADERDVVRYLLQAVDGRGQKVLLLRDICGLAPGQVCERLGISERTLRRERAAALATLHDRLMGAPAGAGSRGGEASVDRGLARAA